jgi:hypothetical protein
VVADMAGRFRNWFIGAVLVVVGVLVGYALPQHTASPSSDIGTVMKVHGLVGDQGSTLLFKAKGKSGTVSYPTEDLIPWQAKSGGPWHHSGQPACLIPDSKVTLGVISVHQDGSAPGGPMIVWVECYS